MSTCYDSHYINGGDYFMNTFLQVNKNIFYIVIVLSGFFVEDGKIYFRYTVFPERGFKGACVITHLMNGVTDLKSEDHVRLMLNQLFERSGIKTFIANAFLDGKNGDKAFVLVFMDRTRTDDCVCSTIIDILNSKHKDIDIRFHQFSDGSFDEVAISIPTDCFNDVATISETFSV